MQERPTCLADIDRLTKKAQHVNYIYTQYKKAVLFCQFCCKEVFMKRKFVLKEIIKTKFYDIITYSTQCQVCMYSR